MALRPPADGADGLDDRAKRAREMHAAVEHRGGPLYDVRHKGDEYRVDLADGTCECPDHRHRGAECKHLRRVAIEVTDGEAPPPSAPRVSTHREHPDQGGARFYRCEGCGRESVRERLRREGCRHCTGEEDATDTETDATEDASTGYGGTAGLATDGGATDAAAISHGENHE